MGRGAPQDQGSLGERGPRCQRRDPDRPPLALLQRERGAGRRHPNGPRDDNPPQNRAPVRREEQDAPGDPLRVDRPPGAHGAWAGARSYPRSKAGKPGQDRYRPGGGRELQLQSGERLLRSLAGVRPPLLHHHIQQPGIRRHEAALQVLPRGLVREERGLLRRVHEAQTRLLEGR